MKILGYCTDDSPVVDRPNSHLHNGVVSLLPEALQQIDPQGLTFLKEEVDLGRIIGETICVHTEDDDQIVFAQRPHRAGLTRFVKGRDPQPCSTVVIILKKAENGDYYILISAFVGESPEPEPWDRNATLQSINFWSTHALIWESEEIIDDTITMVCPW